MKLHLYFLLFCLFFAPFQVKAQDKTLNLAIQYYQSGQYSDAINLFRRAIERDSANVTALYGLARSLFDEQSRLREANRYNIRFIDPQPYLDSYYEAYIISQKAARRYIKLPEPEQRLIRNTFSQIDSDIRGQLTANSEYRSYEVLQSAPYLKDMAALFSANIYDRITEADTLVYLRERLLEQCKQFQTRFPGSRYTEGVTGIRKTLLADYISIVKLRQFGERSGANYERYCASILELFQPEELRHILPEFYGLEYGFGGGSNHATHPAYRKLVQVAEKFRLSPLDFLCQLNLHYGGYTPENADLYDQLIRTFAPADIALVAVQKVAAPLVKAGNMRGAYGVYAKYKPLFPQQASFFDKAMQLFRNDTDTRQLVNLGPAINGPSDDYQPVLSLDGQTLYFARKTQNSGEDVYISRKLNGKWQPAQPLRSPVNTRTHEVPMGISADGKMLILFGNYSQLPDSYPYMKLYEKFMGKGDMYFSEKLATGWGKIEAFPHPVNSVHYEGSLSLSSDGNTLFFASDRPGGIGGFMPNYPAGQLYYHGSGEFNLDIYVSVKKPDGSWGEPINLGPAINTPFAEKNPFLHPDMKTLYFSSDGHYGLGGYDIYMSKRLKEDSWTEWTEPVNMGRAINSIYDDFFYITTTGDRALLVSDRESGGRGRLDIYEVQVPEKVRPDPISVIAGVITDQQGRPVETEVVWETTGTPKKTGKVITQPDDGSYAIAVRPGEEFIVYPEKKRHFSHSRRVDLRTDKRPRVITGEEVELTSLEKNVPERKPFVLKTLYFDNDSDRIRPESFHDLDRLASALRSDATLRLSIEGHTDSNAEDNYNLDLSRRRTESVRRYLIEKGAKAQNLQAEGFGETRPIATNETEEGRQLNRRVEFRVLE